MPGIYGICSQTKILAESLSAMTDAMLLYPHFLQDKKFVDHCVGASRVHLGTVGQKDSPYSDAHGNQVWIEGEVYNLPRVLLEFGWAGEAIDNADLPVWLLHAYQAGKLDAILNRVDGYFCGAIYVPRHRKVLLFSDRHGLRMLYWYHHNGLFAWASEVKGLLAIDSIDCKIDATSLPCFMDLGFLLGEHTWFENIRLIKPATILEYHIELNKLDLRYYWTWGEIQPNKLSFDEAVDSLYECFMHSVQRRFDPNERIGISLSGGLDSRAIFAAVNKLYPDYEGYAYTFGIPNCDDIRIAQQVVSHSNWRHEVFRFSNENWFHPRKELIWNTDGMLDMMHMHGGEFRNQVAENIDVNLNGFAGDVVVGGGWIGLYRKNLRSSDINLQAAYKEYSALAYHRDAYFDLNQVEPGLYAGRVRRFTNMGSVSSLVSVSQRKPFFDNDVIRWAYSVPVEYRENNKVYSVMLQRYFSTYFKDIPWAKTGKPAATLNEKVKSLPMRVLKRLVKIAKSYAGIHHSNGYTDYARWIRDPIVSSEIVRLLGSSNSQYRKLTPEDFLRLYLLPHLDSRGPDKSKQILRALTIEIYMRQVYSQRNGYQLENII